MTETLTPPTVTASADSPLALLFDIAREIGVQGEDEQRDDAETAALDHVWNAYPDTLGKALDEDDWSGKAALAGAVLEPCAVAYLDGGLWLHHSSDGDQEQAVLTLIAPCTCQNGYVDTVLDGEADLLQVLTDLRATGGWWSLCGCGVWCVPRAVAAIPSGNRCPVS
ncbi:hypothetical protein ACFV2H_52300, partial [Streptomyces sp. NPDC059629]|uniref:hypothetical protein n=1 Tax=Streptomyces sp. NPDC059629 TaxID=3346889 RepID=UPI0036C7840C